MAPVLYMVHASPPARAVLMTAKAIGLNLKPKIIDFFNGEHLTPEFRKMNPQHTIPTLVDDDGFVIWDSHAIMAYLVSKYGKDDSLYPTDIQRRAVVDQRLYFEASVVFSHLRDIFTNIFRENKCEMNEKDKFKANEGYKFLEQFLDGKEWISGSCVTIADYSLVASVTSMNVFIPIDCKKYTNVMTWLKKCRNFPEYEANIKGLEEMTTLFNYLMSKNAKKLNK